MFIAAYAAARFLWVPLLGCWQAAKGAPGRSAMWLPIGVGLAATIWEAMIPAQMNIRIDLLLVGPLLILADGLAGLILAGAYRSARKARLPSGAIGAAAALCLAAASFFIGAWVYSDRKSAEQAKEFAEGDRDYFEWAFRDDETQRVAFGRLEGTRWAGYYVGDPPHPNYGHLVVNSAGEYVLFTSTLNEYRGRLKPDADDPALLRGHGIYVGVPSGDVEIRDLGEGRLRFHETHGILGEGTFVKRSPPRFPRAASPDERVHFKGVFSGIYDDSSTKWVGLAQVWLWESDGKWWAVWLRGTHTRLDAQPIFGNKSADVTCIDKACESLEIHVEGDRRERLEWEGRDTLAWSEKKTHIVALKRGELVTGLPYAWAPLTTMEENRKWLRSLHPGLTWQAPPKPAGDLPSSRGG